MALDWLFGPKMVQHIPTSIQLRSLKLNPETISEIASWLRDEFPVGITVMRTEVRGIDRREVEFDLNRLLTCAAWERQNLTIRGFEEPGAVAIEVELRRDWYALVGVPYQGKESSRTVTGKTYSELVYDLADKLVQEGDSRPRWKRFLVALPALVWVAILASWGWLLVGDTPPASGIVFGSLVVLALAPIAYQLSQLITKRYAFWEPGSWVRDVSRVVRREKRSERHRDVWVASLGVLGTLTAGGIVWALTLALK